MRIEQADASQAKGGQRHGDAEQLACCSFVLDDTQMERILACRALSLAARPGLRKSSMTPRRVVQRGQHCRLRRWRCLPVCFAQTHRGRCRIHRAQLSSAWNYCGWSTSTISLEVGVSNIDRCAVVLSSVYRHHSAAYICQDALTRLEWQSPDVVPSSSVKTVYHRQPVRLWLSMPHL